MQCSIQRRYSTSSTWLRSHRTGWKSQISRYDRWVHVPRNMYAPWYPLLRIALVSMSSWSLRHLSQVRRVLRYVSGRWKYCILYPASPITPHSINASMDSDWGADIETKGSTSGFLFTVNRSPIYWRCKRQTIIALFSGEQSTFLFCTELEMEHGYCGCSLSWRFVGLVLMPIWSIPHTIMLLDSSSTMFSAIHEKERPKKGYWIEIPSRSWVY